MADHMNLAADLQAAQNLAHRLGLTVTAQAINNAMNAIGWEVAGDYEQAAKAGRGIRPGEK